MEDLIPLLIVIAISIIGALGRKKKRHEERNISNQGQQSHRDDEIFNWLEKLGIDGDEVSPYHQEEPLTETQHKVVVNDAPVEAKVAVKEVNKYTQFSGFILPEEREMLMAKEGISAIKTKKEVNDLIIKTDEEALEESEKQKFAFDLRQAVIFNEILNRKYV